MNEYNSTARSSVYIENFSRIIYEFKISYNYVDIYPVVIYDMNEYSNTTHSSVFIQIFLQTYEP